MIPSVYDGRDPRQKQQMPSCIDSALKWSKGLRVLLATTNSEIRRSISDVLEEHKIGTVLASTLEQIKSAATKNDIVACFCGFWLVDSTCRDVVTYLRLQREDVPVIIVCEPAYPREYRDFLAALNTRVFDFICHPYRPIDMESILISAIALRRRPAPMPT